MGKTFLAFVFFLLLSFTNTGTAVYICNSKGAKKYHYTESCRGLNASKHQIIQTTQEKAVEQGLTLCGWE